MAVSVCGIYPLERRRSMFVQSREFLVVNPLPATLSQYQKEIVGTFERLNGDKLVGLYLESGDGNPGTLAKIRSAIRILIGRAVAIPKRNASTIIVLWPLFGYFDVITWMLAARRSRIICVVHDPLPLRRQIGHSKFAKLLFAKIVESCGILTVCHTELAGQVVRDETGVEHVLAGHPIAYDSTPLPTERAHSRDIRVMGQYKTARTVDPLIQIAESERIRNFRLEIYGRNWPVVTGWDVKPQFIPEEQFEELIQTSNCVVVPYSRFFQSGVAVRCLESSVPIVAPRHEHIVELFGPDWPGIVHDEDDWVDAVLRVQAIDFTRYQALRENVRRVSDDSWAKLIAGHGAKSVLR
ncbi:glycosyltransferase [Rhodococcus jostii]|uniref:glycosyltransferase n=1 Tax=Rhodococcus jostii TaxID=132919 RepID=UPI0036572135